MNTESIISELEAERNRLDQAITALRDGAVRRGRPTGTGRTGLRRMSAAARRRIALSAKRRWAKAKAAGRNSL